MPGAPETSGRTPLPLCELLCDIADVLKCMVDMQLELLQQSNHPAFGGSARRMALFSRSRSASRRQASNKRPAGPGSSPARRREKASRAALPRPRGAPQAADLVMAAGDRVERRECGTGEKARFFRVFGTLRTRAQPGNGERSGGHRGDSRASRRARRFCLRKGAQAPRVSGDKDVRQGHGAAEGSRPVGRRCFKANSARC
jgi:hypothetical protein